MEWKFELGETLEDKVTGFQGVVMARIEYFTDCVHYGLACKAPKNSKLLDWEYFDETRLVRVKGVKKIAKEKRAIPTSGIYANPPQM